MYSNIISNFFRAAKDINESYMERLKDLFSVESSLGFSSITGGYFAEGSDSQ